MWRKEENQQKGKKWSFTFTKHLCVAGAEKSTFLVVGGQDWIYFDSKQDNNQQTEEIIQLDPQSDKIKRCNRIANLPWLATGGIGEVIEGKPIVCGRDFCAKYDVATNSWSNEKLIQVTLKFCPRKSYENVILTL